MASGMYGCKEIRTLDICFSKFLDFKSRIFNNPFAKQIDAENVSICY